MIFFLLIEFRRNCITCPTSIKYLLDLFQNQLYCPSLLHGKQPTELSTAIEGLSSIITVLWTAKAQVWCLLSHRYKEPACSRVLYGDAMWAEEQCWPIGPTRPLEHQRPTRTHTWLTRHSFCPPPPPLCVAHNWDELKKDKSRLWPRSVGVRR